MRAVAGVVVAVAALAAAVLIAVFATMSDRGLLSFFVGITGCVAAVRISRDPYEEDE